MLFFSSNFALRYQLVPFQCISTRAVIYVWGELWTQPGIEHRAQWLLERGPGDPQNEMYLVWAEIIHQSLIELWTHRQLQWVPGCLFKRGTPIRWLANYLPILKKILCTMQPLKFQSFEKFLRRWMSMGLTWLPGSWPASRFNWWASQACRAHRRGIKKGLRHQSPLLMSWKKARSKLYPKVHSQTIAKT